MNIFDIRVKRDQCLKDIEELFGDDSVKIRGLNRVIADYKELQSRLKHYNDDRPYPILTIWNAGNNTLQQHAQTKIDQLDFTGKTLEQSRVIVDEALSLKEQELRNATGELYEQYMQLESDYRKYFNDGMSDITVIRSKGKLPPEFNVLQTLATQESTPQFKDIKAEDCLWVDVTGDLDFKFNQWETNADGKIALIIRTGYQDHVNNHLTEPNIVYLQYARHILEFMRYMFIASYNLPYQHIVVYGTTTESSVYMTNTAFELTDESNLTLIRKRTETVNA